MNETLVTLVGNIGGGDPELRFLGNGTAVCKFRMAVTPRKFKDGKWEDQEPSWFQVTAWRSLGENVAESLRNGDRVIVQGNLQVRQYEDREGVKRTSTEVEALSVGADLTFATAKPVKAARSGGNGGGQRSGDGWGDAQPAQQRQQAAAPPSDSW